MMRYVIVALVLAPLFAAPAARGAAAKPAPLWQIGKPDGGNAEFALASNRYRDYAEDGFFAVGASEERLDWPYVHPGPNDGWAGSRQHTFTVLFCLAAASGEGDCRLLLDLLDTHGTAPPRLRVALNGEGVEIALPRGAGDASVFGEPARGKRHACEVALPAQALAVGDNELTITTLSGGWLLYDAVAFRAPAGVAPAPVASRTVVESIQAPRALREQDGALVQDVRVRLRHFGAPVDTVIHAGAAAAVPVRLDRRAVEAIAAVPAVDRPTDVAVTVEAGGATLAARTVALKPVRKLLIYILPHSHTDIGYTEIQQAIEEKQINNLVQGIEHARRTADYPAGARFVWNVEVLWAADLYLNRLSPEHRAVFLEAVRSGQVALNGMYLNELTGLCRPEELVVLFRYATRLAAMCGTTIDAAMISDVPGYTWGTVTAMAHAGIKYFSTAPNYFDRIGDILVQWENKPFYWIGPSGRDKVLVWIPYLGYAMSHVVRHLTPRVVEDYQAKLEEMGYPYDIAHMRWSGHGDNAVPDPSICEFVRDWNTRHAWPRFVIASTSEAFRAFETRYGAGLPEVRGDWTPYWEDGAGSSALETAMNRASSERLTQAEAAFALLDPARYPPADAEEAWRSVLLYSEHTWGAWCSVSDPENAMTKEQWAVKRSYALKADELSRALLERIVGPQPPPAGPRVEVLNTTSWPRTDLVVVPAAAGTGDLVRDAAGAPVPSQRLSDGTLAFVARDVPPFAARAYSIAAGPPHVVERAEAKGHVLENALLRLRIDPATGAVVELEARGVPGNLVDSASGHALNDYLFLPGDDLAKLERNGPVTVTVKEKGPLVASLLVESAAPGCRRLAREIRLTAGLDRVEFLNTVDKERAAISASPGDWGFAQKGGKESVNFAFPFSVPDGILRLEVPLGVMRPEVDQIPSACKNWFTVGRWADVSNGERGVTWATLDAPLVQVGGITATLLGSQSNPAVWRQRVEPTQRLYAWVMNNHWGTNYRAYQEGPVAFRFAVRPHGRYDAAEAGRFATALSQPLLVMAPGRSQARTEPRLRVAPGDVLATALKVSDDGKALILRLYGASGETRRATIEWAAPAPSAVFLSDTSERPGAPVSGPVEVPGFGLVTLRAEFAR